MQTTSQTTSAVIMQEGAPPRQIHVSEDVGRSWVQLGGFFAENKLAPPPKDTPLFSCKVEVFPGTEIEAFAWGSYILVGQKLNPYAHNRRYTPEPVDPFVSLKVVSDRAYSKDVTRKERRQGYYGRFSHTYAETTGPDRYLVSGRDYDGTAVYREYRYLKVEVTVEGVAPVVAEMKFRQPTTGLAQVGPRGEVTISGEFFGCPYVWRDDRNIVGTGTDHNPAYDLLFCLTKCQLDQDKSLWWDLFLGEAQPRKKFSTARVKKARNNKAVKPNLDRLETEEPLLYAFFQFLHDARTKDKGCNNTLLAAMLGEVGPDYDKLVKTLRDALVFAETVRVSERIWSHDDDQWLSLTRPVCQSLPGASDRVQAEAEKADWSKRKSLSGQADGLGITMEEHPKLYGAVTSGDIPTTIFRQPSKAPVNREYHLWERALAREGWAEPIYAIAQTASRRGTYEKDMTPYLSFLFQIERYLTRHAPFKTGGKKGRWQAMPKFVQSQWELEMDDPSDTGTTKKRSAFTPVADNQTHVVTVPYVAVAVSGVRTQWCYSRFYHVYEEGFIDPEASGSVVVRDLEPKLNGRDDYGLMFFTLTGTVTARGYPTFLIIFERLQTETRVHFHRVHPSRTRGEEGGRTQACHLIAECYRYMAGNVRAEEIVTQQGDLLFIRMEHDPIKAGSKVAQPCKVRSFESHEFIPFEGDPLTLYANEAKGEKNRLGFLLADHPFKVQHPEHEDIKKLDAGFWEVRRCRSWEANPKAIWSLNID
jgi:hypothetical protein